MFFLFLFIDIPFNKCNFCPAMDLAPPSERKRTPGEFHQVQNPETNDIDKMVGGKWRLAIRLSGIKRQVLPSTKSLEHYAEKDSEA